MEALQQGVQDRAAIRQEIKGSIEVEQRNTKARVDTLVDDLAAMNSSSHHAISKLSTKLRQDVGTVDRQVQTLKEDVSVVNGWLGPWRESVDGQLEAIESRVAPGTIDFANPENKCTKTKAGQVAFDGEALRVCADAAWQTLWEPVPLPVIESVGPKVGRAGEVITVKGKHFVGASALLEGVDGTKIDLALKLTSDYQATFVAPGTNLNEPWTLTLLSSVGGPSNNVKAAWTRTASTKMFLLPGSGKFEVPKGYTH